MCNMNICSYEYGYLFSYRLKHGIGADQDYFMLYQWYRKNKHDINKFYKLIRLKVTHLT